jgi:hypothetical protein
MRGVRIPHHVNGEDRFVLGLSVTRLAALLSGYWRLTPSFTSHYPRPCNSASPESPPWLTSQHHPSPLGDGRSWTTVQRTNER